MTRVITDHTAYSEWEKFLPELHESVLAMLHEHGPLNTLMVQYFLKREHDTIIDSRSVSELMEHMMVNKKPIMEIVTYVGGNTSGIEATCWCIDGDEERPPINAPSPADNDYADAYVTLYYRWQAVRANPALLELTDQYIDDLYGLNSKTVVGDGS